MHVSARRVGQRRAARRHRGPHRPRPDRHGRARPQGRGGDRRLRLASWPRPGEIGAVTADYDLAETVDYLEEQGRPGDRPPRRLPRPDLRAGGVGGRRPRPGPPDARRATCSPPTAASRTTPTRRCGSTTSPSRSRRIDGREGHPLGLHPPARGRPRHDGGPGPAGPELRRGGRVPRRDARVLAATGRLPGRVGVRHRGGGRRQHRPGRPGDGRRRRLPGADGLPVALGPGHVPRRQPDQPALRHREEVAGRLPARRPEHRRAVPAVAAGLHARTACPTASTRCGSRSAPPRSSASRASCCGTRTSRYTDEALDPIP